MDAAQVLAHLDTRGLSLGQDPRVTPLTGGVSAAVHLVESGPDRWVVKQSLAELRVASEWRATTRRALTEAAALRLAGTITPTHVPELLDVDGAHETLVMSAAPAEALDWRSSLLSGASDDDAVIAVARELGRILGAWHEATWRDRDVQGRFADYEAFEQLRLTPFHRAVQAAHPRLVGPLSACIDDLETGRECLVHGDFSPKNVLVGPDLLWVLDFEVAHFGAATFDLAFLGHHLALKAFVGPHAHDVLAAAFAEFLASYQAELASSPCIERLGWHLAALMLARVDGVSPASYVSDRHARAIRAAATEILSGDDASATGAWDVVRRSAEAGR